MKPGYEVGHYMDDEAIGKNDVTAAEICNYDGLNKVGIYYWSSDVKNIQADYTTVAILKIKRKK
jgi:hypothetical protein